MFFHILTKCSLNFSLTVVKFPFVIGFFVDLTLLRNMLCRNITVYLVLTFFSKIECLIHICDILYKGVDDTESNRYNHATY
jgi:hypothetical protein